MADYKQEIKIGTCCQLSKYGKTFEEDCDTGIVVSIKQRRCNHFNDLEGLDVTFFDGIKMVDWFIETDEHGNLEYLCYENGMLSAHNQDSDNIPIRIIQ